MNFSDVEKEILCSVADIFEIPKNAYNFRVNGKSIGRKSTENINIVPKAGGKGLDVFVKAGVKNEQVHIPVVISATGLSETVYNDFHIGEGAEVTIVAGCGIYNCGGKNSVHDGIHRFFIEKGAKVRYIERHLGMGPGAAKILNPRTELSLGKNSEAMLFLEQIKGVDSTVRKTTAELGENAKLFVKERLFTHGRQTAESIYDVNLSGANAHADIASRSVAQDCSKQTFNSLIVGNNECRGHSECDAIIMDEASVVANPSLQANNTKAELVHEAAIGKIASEQIMKLMTLGLSKKEAESKIINGFMK